MKTQIIEKEENGYSWLVDLYYIDDIETLEYYLKENNADFDTDEKGNFFAEIEDVKKADKTAFKDDVIDQIDFSKDDYDTKTEGDGFNSFDDFIAQIVNITIEECGGIHDAVFVANDAYSNL